MIPEPFPTDVAVTQYVVLALNPVNVHGEVAEVFVETTVPPDEALYKVKVVDTAPTSAVKVTVKLVVDPEVAATDGLFAFDRVEKGTTAELASEAVPVPLALIAATRKTYEVPFVNPVTVALVLVLVPSLKTVHVLPLLEE